MADFDRRTGALIGNFDSALQHVEVILTTRISSMVLLREFGGGAVELLGRALTRRLFLAWLQLVGTAIDLWEPRFAVRQFRVDGSPEALRRGHTHLDIEVDWRPRGHLGDLTVERTARIRLLFHPQFNIAR